MKLSPWILWCCIIVLKFTFLNCQYNGVYFSRRVKGKHYPYKYYTEENRRNYIEERVSPSHSYLRYDKYYFPNSKAFRQSYSEETYSYPLISFLADAVRSISSGFRRITSGFQNLVPSTRALARIFVAMANGDPLPSPCEGVVCTGDSNVCIYGKCSCGKNGGPCSRTNPTCHFETGTCQCGPKRNEWGGPYNICFLGQVCNVIGDVGRCKDADLPK